MRDREDPTVWHGAHIVNEDELSFKSDGRAKKRARRRQNTVFLILSTLVVVVFVGAVLIHQGVLQLGGSPQAAQASEPSTPVIGNEQCPDADFSYQDPASFEVRVLNTTSISGLAGRTAEALEQRGFQISSVTSGLNSYSAYDAVIFAGPKGYAQAFTIQRQVPDALFVFDEAMYGTEVDLALGEGFTSLAKERKVDTTPGKLNCLSPQGG